MSFNFIGKQRERADHEKSGKGRVTAVRMDRRSEKSEDKRRMLCDEPVVGGRNPRRNPLKKKVREIGYILEY